MELAKKLGMPMTAGSDAHRTEDIARAAVLSDEPIVSEKQYADLLLAGKLKLMLLDEIL